MVEARRRKVAHPQVVQLLAYRPELGEVQVAGLRLEHPLLAVPLSDHVLPELDLPMDETHVGEPLRAEHGHERFVKRAFANGVKKGVDGVVEQALPPASAA